MLKRDQGKGGGGRERKTEWERKARASERACVWVCMRAPHVYAHEGASAWTRAREETPSGRETGARGPESRRSEHVLLSASRVEKARGNFQVLKRPLITRDRAFETVRYTFQVVISAVSAHLPRLARLIARPEESKMENRRSPVTLGYLLHASVSSVLLALRYTL